MVFFSQFFQVDICNGVFFKLFYTCVSYLQSLFCQVKRKQALLESNLPGIHLMADKNVKQWVI